MSYVQTYIRICASYQQLQLPTVQLTLGKYLCGAIQIASQPIELEEFVECRLIRPLLGAHVT